MSLERLEELAPDLAAWWRKRRREAWREAGLVRPMTLEEAAANIHRAFAPIGAALKETLKPLSAHLKRVYRSRMQAADLKRLPDALTPKPVFNPESFKFERESQ